jgi:sugar lactone lactonase YvrE
MLTLRTVQTKTGAATLLGILLASICNALVPEVARAGDLYVGNFGTGTISQITPAGDISTYATIPQFAGDSFNYEIAFNHSGDIFVADPLGANGTGTVYEVAPGGSVSTFATGLGSLSGLAVDAANDVYVSDTSGTITKITPSGAVSTFASGLPSLFGLAFDSTGNLYASAPNNNILKLNSLGAASVFASNIEAPLGLTTDAVGNVYAATSNSSDEVVKITPTGSVTTYASGLLNPTTLAFDGTGNLFVGDDFGSHSISEVAPGCDVSMFVDNTSLNPWGLAFQHQTASVPEPSSLVLIGIAAIGLGITYVRRTQLISGEE